MRSDAKRAREDKPSAPSPASSCSPDRKDIAENGRNGKVGRVAANSGADRESASSEVRWPGGHRRDKLRKLSPSRVPFGPDRFHSCDDEKERALADDVSCGTRVGQRVAGLSRACRRQPIRSATVGQLPSPETPCPDPEDHIRSGEGIEADGRQQVGESMGHHPSLQAIAHEQRSE